jgi:hypothetical protein
MAFNSNAINENEDTNDDDDHNLLTSIHLLKDESTSHSLNIKTDLDQDESQSSNEQQQQQQEIPEDNIIIFGRNINMSRTQLVTVSLITINFFLCSAYYSLFSPFMPGEAIQKGISQTQVGIIFGVYQLVLLILSPIFGKYVTFHSISRTTQTTLN